MTKLSKNHMNTSSYNYGINTYDQIFMFTTYMKYILE